MGFRSTIATYMNAPWIPSASQNNGDKRIETRLSVIDSAFVTMRGIVITGGFFWLTLHPFPDTLKFQLVSLFLIFVIYSFVIHGLVVVWPKAAEIIYLICLGLDMIFIGFFIKLSGGINSILFLAIYLLVALHAFYYGFLRGVGLAALASFVYIISVHAQWGSLSWTDLLFRIAIIFLIAGFLGFISEKEKRDKDELVKTRLRLDSLQGELERSYENLQDIKAQIEQSEVLASIGRLSAELAHEINNPLDGIKNCLTVIKDSGDPEKKKRYLELIDEAICDIENAVRDLLDYAKRHEPKLEEIDVTSILQRTIAMTGYKLQNAGIELITGLDPDLPHILGDPHQLQEVFFNIILNAIDAMPEGGRLALDARLMSTGDSDFVHIVISDTGTGIPKEDMERIFQPFYTTKSLGKGTGLGLPVSLEIVKKHNGTINVSSETGKRTSFTISLPVTRTGDSIHKIEGDAAA